MTNMQAEKFQHRWLIPLVILLGFFSDGSLSLAFSGFFFDNSLQMAPQLFLMALVLCTFAMPASNLLFWYALLGGLAYDLFYTGLIGLYTLIGPLTYLLTKFLLNYFGKQPIYQLGTFVITVLVGQVILFFLADFFNLTSASLGSFISDALGPTILLNVILFAIFFWPTRWLLQFIHQKRGR
ncbi:rod shape-determining protein MreD [Lapidilactobacillus achengensis]|uniref:Rod shape-determining protein MreD n=1 Tax=Lapidilactobacillus achengensis TaxID=2486000 RepID=A0ABW1URJ4_9LACO|nr:rod shape-determining protein MreD [Lapidilactobacillus achengensis]